ncbi:hypothetical protein CSC94_09720 [Zhengella mangrovi]|uniref:Uncharacterized protein n=1 Tax=Zhengella mangrovi TaxID=1982044 RepID=A0A2G1QQ11_9HYPH|nr:hypothetical protein [Zhengella mangrovi]PHP67308.1 hypothetical protein CSC94_09720 [Zhengella mangrovi]
MDDPALLAGAVAGLLHDTSTWLAVVFAAVAGTKQNQLGIAAVAVIGVVWRIVETTQGRETFGLPVDVPMLIASAIGIACFALLGGYSAFLIARRQSG